MQASSGIMKPAQRSSLDTFNTEAVAHPVGEHGDVATSDPTYFGGHSAQASVILPPQAAASLQPAPICCHTTAHTYRDGSCPGADDELVWLSKALSAEAATGLDIDAYDWLH